MIMSYRQFMQNQDNDQKKQIEIEKIQSALLNELSFMDYDANNDIKESLYDIAHKLVNNKSKIKGFRNMPLEQYCIAYNKSI